jgi:hypothetical protein
VSEELYPKWLTILPNVNLEENLWFY